MRAAASRIQVRRSVISWSQDSLHIPAKHRDRLRLRIEVQQVRAAAEPFVSKPFSHW
jgi:hypothetical protein